MIGGEREGLIARIRQIRRLAQVRDLPSATPDPRHSDRVSSLEVRVAHLEQMVEGLQDSVYRESERHERLIAEIQAQIQPGPMGTALSDHARDRGL
jgi:hypothetical protein